jgi:hypothetical protein
MELVKRLFNLGTFVRSMRVHLRFGELSRSSLNLMRFEVRGNTAECEWMARPADPWDEHLPTRSSEGHASKQALEDAIAVRELLFHVLPEVETASLRVYRRSSTGHQELIISGSVVREPSPTRHFHSVAMKAKLLGLQFWLEDGILMAMPLDLESMSAHSGERDLATAGA